MIKKIKSLWAIYGFTIKIERHKCHHLENPYHDYPDEAGRECASKILVGMGVDLRSWNQKRWDGIHKAIRKGPLF